MKPPLLYDHDLEKALAVAAAVTPEIRGYDEVRSLSPRDFHYRMAGEFWRLLQDVADEPVDLHSLCLELACLNPTYTDAMPEIASWMTCPFEATEHGAKEAARRIIALASLRQEARGIGEKISLLAGDAEESEPPKRTDLGNAMRFAGQHSERARFVPKWGAWVVWDSMRWRRDDDRSIERLALDTVRSIDEEADGAVEDEERKTLEKWADASEAGSRIAAMLRWAEPMMVVDAALLDADPWLLNTRNGTLDLRTGVLRPHDPGDLLTKAAGTYFDPKAEAPKWREFLRLVSGGDEGLEQYLQVATGYSLTGLIDEQCLFFLHGGGINGKTTFLSTLLDLHGDYGARVDVGILLASNRETNAATPHLARLQGIRLAVATEIPRGSRLDESRVKDLTGGDRMIARYLYGNPIEFKPTHKLWLMGNHRPTIAGTDEGIWRRMRLVPFLVTIPPTVVRPESEVLAEFRAEMPGILAWAVRGVRMFAESGLPRSQAVLEATTEYRKDEDVLEAFLDEEVEIAPGLSCPKKEVRSRYVAWLQKNGEDERTAGSQRWLTQQLQRKGVTLGGHGKSRYVGARMREG